MKLLVYAQILVKIGYEFSDSKVLKRLYFLIGIILDLLVFLKTRG